MKAILTCSIAIGMLAVIFFVGKNYLSTKQNQITTPVAATQTSSKNNQSSKSAVTVPALPDVNAKKLIKIFLFNKFIIFIFFLIFDLCLFAT